MDNDLTKKGKIMADDHNKTNHISVMQGDYASQ